MKILLPEARNLFAAAGARVADDMVFIGRDLDREKLEAREQARYDREATRPRAPARLVSAP